MLSTINWKRLFFLLLSTNILVLLVILILISLPVDNDEKIVKKEPIIEDETVAFSIKTNKKDLNKIINYYIEKESANGFVNYEVYLTDFVELYGYLPVLGQNIQMKLTFEPKSIDNGDLILYQKNISIGQLSLPNSYIMKIIKNHYKFPEMVKIQPNEERIYIDFEKLEMKSNLKVSVDEFDLPKDNIKFVLKLPIK